jgi:hypothetical protein
MSKKTPPDLETFTVGPRTLAVLNGAGLYNLSDMQAVLDAFEVAHAARNAEIERQAKRIEQLEGALAKRMEPDMLWDAENPEQPYDCVENLLYERDYEGEGVVEVQRAIQMPNTAYHYKFRDRADTDDTEIDVVQLSDGQYREMLACRSVGHALRAMWDEKVRRKAEELYLQYKESDPEIFSATRFYTLPYHLSQRLKREALAALTSPMDGQGDGSPIVTDWKEGETRRMVGGTLVYRSYEDYCDD